MRLTKNQNILNYFIFLMLDFYLIVDSMTGILMHTFGISLSIPYKLFLICLISFATFAFCTNFVISISLSILWICFSCLFFAVENYKQMALAMQNYMKFFANFIFYFYFINLSKYDRFDKQIYKLLFINTAVFFSNILLGIFGFGYSTYGYGIGIKGFFYAGNEIFLILLSTTVFFLLCKRKYIPLLYLISVVTSILIGTKTAMLALLLIISFDFYFHLSKIKKILFLALLPVLIIIFIFVFHNFLMHIRVVESALYNFDKVKNNSGSILNALMSGRIVFLKNNIHRWEEKLNILNFAFGGYNYFNNKNIEIDFFDALFLNGGIVTFVVLGFYIFFIMKAIVKKRALLIVFNITILSISFLAGHIWANLTGGLFFIIVNVYGYKKTLKPYWNLKRCCGVKYVFSL